MKYYFIFTISLLYLAAYQSKATPVAPTSPAIVTLAAEISSPTAATNIPLVYQGGIWVSSFGEYINGELYVLDHRGGIVYQIQS